MLPTLVLASALCTGGVWDYTTLSCYTETEDVDSAFNCESVGIKYTCRSWDDDRAWAHTVPVDDNVCDMWLAWDVSYAAAMPNVW